MSDFDSNPFADPTHTSPFQDPSVQQATANSSRGLEEFNPFEDNNKQTATKVPPPVPAQLTQPAVVNTSQDKPPAYTPSAAQPITPNVQDDLLKRQAELEKKAEELQRREQQLRNAQYNIRENNFPPLPKWFCLQPCFYQDFAIDIPTSFQRTVKMGFYLWMAYSILLAVNLVVALAYFVSSTNIEGLNAGQTFGLALLYVVIFPASSYVCWFRPVYKAFRNDSSFNFFLFFFIFFFQCIVTVVLCLGFSNIGTCGLLNSFSYTGISDSTGGLVVAWLMVAVAVAFTILAVLNCFYLVQVHTLYRGTGASFEKAQKEFAQGVVTNPGVQAASKQAASAAVSGAMSGAMSTGNQSGNQM